MEGVMDRLMKNIGLSSVLPYGIEPYSKYE
jgi:hypothetical protein